MFFAGNEDLYAYRYDWDNLRDFFVGDFRKIIGAAHALEIPMISGCLLYTSPSPRDKRQSRMPSSA